MRIFKSFRWFDYLLAALLVAIVVVQVTFEMRLIETMGELVGVIQSHYQYKTSLTMADIWAVAFKMLINAATILASVLVVEGATGNQNELNDLSLEEHIKHYTDMGIDRMSAIKQVASDRNLKKSDVYNAVNKN